MKDQLAIKWGLHLFLATISWMVFEKLMGWHDENIHQHATFSILYDLLFLVVFFFAYRAKKKEQMNIALQWKKWFFFGLKLTLIVVLLSPLVQLIVHQLLSPSFLSNIVIIAVEDGILTEEEALARFNLKSYLIQNLIGTALLGVLCSLLFSFLFRKKTF